jgi:hypothetical protein
MLFLVLYPIIGVLVCAYIVSKDSRYVLEGMSTSSNFGWLIFTVAFWPLVYLYALGDSIERQKEERDKK